MFCPFCVWYSSQNAFYPVREGNRVGSPKNLSLHPENGCPGRNGLQYLPRKSGVYSNVCLQLPRGKLKLHVGVDRGPFQPLVWRQLSFSWFPAPVSGVACWSRGGTSIAVLRTQGTLSAPSGWHVLQRVCPSEEQHLLLLFFSFFLLLGLRHLKIETLESNYKYEGVWKAVMHGHGKHRLGKDLRRSQTFTSGCSPAEEHPWLWKDSESWWKGRSWLPDGTPWRGSDGKL